MTGSAAPFLGWKSTNHHEGQGEIRISSASQVENHLCVLLCLSTTAPDITDAAMRTITAISSLLAAAICVSATGPSHPVLAFTSPHASSVQLELPTDSSLAGLIDSLYAPGKITPACKLDAVVLVEAENLNRDAFASLRHSSSNSLRARSLNAPSQVTFNAAPAADVFDLLVERASKACGYGDLDITTLGAFESLNPTKNPRFVDIKAGDLRKDGRFNPSFRLTDEQLGTKWDSNQHGSFD